MNQSVGSYNKVMRQGYRSANTINLEVIKNTNRNYSSRSYNNNTKIKVCTSNNEFSNKYT